MSIKRVGIYLAALAICGCAATPQAGTPPAAATAELMETYWRLAQVEGQAVVIHAGTREPHIVLRRGGARVTGFAGCNSLAGGYKHDDRGTLVFGPLITTRMACVGTGDALESAFLKALQVVASYRISGESLELRDAAGATRILFEARPPQ